MKDFARKKGFIEIPSQDASFFYVLL
jgi:hypothetical protein